MMIKATSLPVHNGVNSGEKENVLNRADEVEDVRITEVF
jgi:hypothetical protein